MARAGEERQRVNLNPIADPAPRAPDPLAAVTPAARRAEP